MYTPPKQKGGVGGGVKKTSVDDLTKELPFQLLICLSVCLLQGQLTYQAEITNKQPEQHDAHQLWQHMYTAKCVNYNHFKIAASANWLLQM